MNNIEYITYDQLMASIESDISSYADSGLIDRGKYIKIARKVNEDLGLKIFKEVEGSLKIENYKADLPPDFKFLQLALICGEPTQYHLGPGSIFGTHTEETNVTAGCVKPDKICLNSNGGAYWVTQTFKDKTVQLPKLHPIKLTKKSLKYCGDKCVNTTWSGAYELDLENGQAVTNFREGEIYINYLSDMVDKDNNILIINHPLLVPFYEYAIKKHIFENLLMNGDADVERRYMMIKNELRDARVAALNFLNTVEYTDIQDSYNANRARFYNKYYKMFDNG